MLAPVVVRQGVRSFAPVACHPEALIAGIPSKTFLIRLPISLAPVVVRQEVRSFALTPVPVQCRPEALAAGIPCKIFQPPRRSIPPVPVQCRPASHSKAVKCKGLGKIPTCKGLGISVRQCSMPSLLARNRACCRGFSNRPPSSRHSSLTSRLRRALHRHLANPNRPSKHAPQAAGSCKLQLPSTP